MSHAIVDVQPNLEPLEDGLHRPDVIGVRMTCDDQIEAMDVHGAQLIRGVLATVTGVDQHRLATTPDQDRIALSDIEEVDEHDAGMRW